VISALIALYGEATDASLRHLIIQALSLSGDPMAADLFRTEAKGAQDAEFRLEAAWRLLQHGGEGRTIEAIETAVQAAVDCLSRDEGGAEVSAIVLHRGSVRLLDVIAQTYGVPRVDIGLTSRPAGERVQLVRNWWNKTRKEIEVERQ